MGHDKSAIIKWINYKKTSFNDFDKAIKYVTNVKAAPREYTYFGHIDPDTAVQDLRTIENRYQKRTDSRLYKHLVCSFGASSLKAEEAYRFMKELMAPFRNEYPVIFAIHTNIPKRIHAHALIGMTNLWTGKKFSQGPRDLTKFRQKYNVLAEDFHLPILRQRCPPQPLKTLENNNSNISGGNIMHYNEEDFTCSNNSFFPDNELGGNIIPPAPPLYQPGVQGPVAFQSSPVAPPVQGGYPVQGMYMPQGGQIPPYSPQSWRTPQGMYMPQGGQMSPYFSQSWCTPQGMYMPQGGQSLQGIDFYDDGYYPSPWDYAVFGGMMMLTFLKWSSQIFQPAVVEKRQPVMSAASVPVADHPSVPHEKECADSLRIRSTEPSSTIHGYRGVFDDKAYGVYDNSELFNASWKYWRRKFRQYKDFDTCYEAHHFAVQGLANLTGTSVEDVATTDNQLNYRTIVF